MDAARFTPCTATQEKSVGFVEPRGHGHGPLVESINGHRILKLKISTKTVPAAEIRKKAQEAADRIEAETGRKPGKREMKSLQDEAKLSLLPDAFAKEAVVVVWHDPSTNLVVTDAVSQSKLDDVITLMVRTFVGLALTPLQTNIAPQTAMAQWLLAASPDEWPQGISVERECELRASDESKARVKFTHHHLQNDDVRRHIKEGKLPTRLALSWDGRITFVLSDTLQLKKLTYLDGVFDSRSAQQGDDYDPFDADVSLATGELGKALQGLFDALGGLANSGQPA